MSHAIDYLGFTTQQFTGLWIEPEAWRVIDATWRISTRSIRWSVRYPDHWIFTCQESNPLFVVDRVHRWRIAPDSEGTELATKFGATLRIRKIA